MKKIFSLFCLGSFLWGTSLQAETDSASVLDLGKVFQGSPIIYTTLLILSLLSFILWLYSLLTLRTKDMVPKVFLADVKEMIKRKQFDSVLNICNKDHNFISSIIASGISVRHHESKIILDAMQSEGKRVGTGLWQRISILNDISVISPMLGLLGTVLGMFYAFYDSNQSIESITALFDGLGIAIGTTVAGLIVAILSMFFQTTLKFRVIKLLNDLEDESMIIGNLIAVTEKIRVSSPPTDTLSDRF